MRFIQVFFASCILTCMIFYCVIFVFIDAPVKASYWVAEMIFIKKELVKAHSGKNKILVAGGSSTLFGIDAEYATKSLGIPVVNFGLTAGVRLEKILHEVSLVVESGDSLILPLEPTYYDCNSKLDPAQVSEIIGWDHEAWKVMGYKERLELVSLVSPTLLGQMIVAAALKNFYPSLIEDRLNALNQSLVLSKFKERKVPTEFAYSAYNINNHGDMLATNGSRYNGKDDDVSKPLHVCDRTANILVVFVDRMRNKGVRVFFANTPYPGLKSSSISWKNSEVSFKNEMAKIGCFIDSREDLIFDRKYFFNTHLHLNAGGRFIRTDNLIKAIRKNVLSENCNYN
ncbi:MAG: hypothetical protein BVN35_05695 [Proteobacteria bacterium ST_bin11]|nr:MAG: hypothetical protein BVN35_05695 [Proteobacteria bacterium ST_bin11]